MSLVKTETFFVSSIFSPLMCYQLCKVLKGFERLLLKALSVLINRENEVNKGK